jgi:hypothetical protein
MNNLISCFAFLLLLGFFACKDEENTFGLDLAYLPCCGPQPVEFNKDSYYIFVPNCFTPNGDNINDVFAYSLSNNIDSVRYYRIYADANPASLLFASDNFRVYEWQDYAWYGNLYNRRYKGKFRYKIGFVTNQGNEIEVNGSACAILCGEGAGVFIDRPGCFYPSQASAIYWGKVDRLIPSGEDHCFEE